MKQIKLFYSLLLFFIQMIPAFAGKDTENSTNLHTSKNKNIILLKNNSVFAYEKEKALKTNLMISKLLQNIQANPSPALYQELANIYGYSKRNETIYSDPKDLQGHQQKALALAIQTYEEGITIFPNASELYCGFGKLQFCANHDYTTAINIFKKGIEICPSADLHYALADVYRYGIKDTKLAIEACKKGLKSYCSLNLYLALGNHLSFLSRSRIDYKYKIKCKKEALEAYQNALNFEKTNTEYKTILQSLLTLYCELTDIYTMYIDTYAQELSIYQRKALDTYNIAQQLTDFYIHEKTKTKIEAISFLYQESNEQSTVQELKNTKEIIPENMVTHTISTLNVETKKTDFSNESKIIWNKFAESIKPNTEIIHEIEFNNSSAPPANKNNIIWGDSIEPIEYSDAIYEENLDHALSNYTVEILDHFEIARNNLNETIKDFNNHSNFYKIQKKVTEKLQICSNYIENNFLYGFYTKLGEIYYNYFTKFEAYFHQKAVYIEKTLYYFNCALNYGYYRDNTEIIQKMSLIYYELIRIYCLNLSKHESNIHQKKDYLEKAINVYHTISVWDNSQNYKKINKLISFCYYDLGNIYNFDLSKSENDYFQKKDYLGKALDAYEKAIQFDNPTIKKKIKHSIECAQNTLKYENSILHPL